MITTINEFKNHLNEHIIDKLKKVYDTLKIYLNENNIILDDTFLYVDNNFIGDIRLSTYENYIVMEMIDLKEKYQRLGYGTMIYKSLLKSALDNGYAGIFSIYLLVNKDQLKQLIYYKN